MDMNLSKLWEITKDRRVWHAAVHGATKSQTRLSNWTAIPYKWKESDKEYIYTWRDIDICLNHFAVYLKHCKLAKVHWNLKCVCTHTHANINIYIYMCVCVCVCVCTCVLSHFSHVWLCVTLWNVAHQAPLSMESSKHEYWSGLPCPPPGNLPNPEIESEYLMSPALAGGFFTTRATWEACI